LILKQLDLKSFSVKIIVGL